ncbi:SDR family NAD(P)-dependent oxidoreductase, partial [Consotaella aegiceratis]|uniref:SDR family NAD(P)-dependent oxidoreductase n=1 Tax=Consotaella aegiceratis TaxID=3097961 RepID=UPI002F410848
MKDTAPFPDLNDAVAIIGMSCRFPDATSPVAFWDNLLAGHASIRPLRPDEVADTPTARAIKSDPGYVNAAAPLEGLDQFDPDFFDMTEREAELSDPQLRLLMMACADALQHAGYGAGLGAQHAGAYLACHRSAYFLRNIQPRTDLMQTFSRQISNLNEKDFVATFIANKLNLHGPAMTVATACSSSLVAVHQAVKSLLTFECDVSLAGGASINPDQNVGYVSRPGGITSGSGVCRVFDAGADGTVFGSGAGVVVLKRYEDAVADGDFVHAVILGSAVNNDGARKVGFTAPSVAGQTEVILEALEAAGVHADELGLIEAHGTGTRLGDPIEVRALQAGFAAQRGQTDLPPPVPRAQAARCFLGSVKSNIGHLDTAAGVAGLIKAALAVRHGEIPATLNFSRLNPEIDLSDGRFEIAASRRPWPNSVAGGPVARRVAGVSAFGIGGTNVHMILSAAPERPAAESDRSEESPQALFLSARSAAALAQYRTDLAAWLERAEAEAHPLPAIAATLRTRRPAATWRLAVIAASRTEAAAALRAAPLPAGETTAPGALAFVFPGQGSQHPAMIAPHYARHVVYRVAYDRVASAMPAPVRSVLEDLARGTHVSEAALARTEVTQPALFAASYAAAALWQAREVHPEAGLLGHSIGEYAAACLAGVMTPESAARIVAARGALMQAAPPGRMLAVGLSAEDLAPYLAEGEVDIAALNGPRQTVLAGSEAAIAALRDRLAANGQRSVVLATSHGFHSRLFDEAAARFAEIIAAEPLKPPQARVISNVTGAVLKAEAAQDPAYWARQMRAPVRFHDGLVTLMSGPTPPQAILEVGPGATLTGLIRHAALTPRPVCLPGSPPAPQTTDDPFLTTAATLWTLGHPSSWPTPPHTTPPLPTPKLNTRDFWIGEMTETGAPPQQGEVLKPVLRDLPEPDAARPRHVTVISFTDGTAHPLDGLDVGTELGVTLSCHALLVPDGVEAPGWGAFRALLPNSGDGSALVLGLPDLDKQWKGTGRNTAFLSELFHHLTCHPLVPTLLVSSPACTGPGAAEAAAFAATARAELQPTPFGHLRAEQTPRVSHIMQALACLPRATRFVLSDGGLQVEDLALCDFPDRSSAKPHVTARVTLIAGGLGGIGRALVEQVDARAGDRFILLTRRDPDAQTDAESAWLDEMAARSRDVVVIACDITDADAVGTVLADLQASGRLPDEIVHAAGLAEGRMLRTKPDQMLSIAYGIKVQGALNLLDVARRYAIPRVVLFSSISAIRGDAGQSGYGAANAALMALARQAQKEGPKVTAILWDRWHETGMADPKRMPPGLSEMAARAAQRPALPVPEAVAWFDRLREIDEPCVIVAARRPQATAAPEARGSTRAPAQMRDIAEVTATLRAIWSDLLGNDNFGNGDNFFDVGGDSVLLVALHDQIQTRLQTDVPLERLFEHPNVSTQARFFASNQDAPQAARVKAAADTGPSGSVAIIGMSLRCAGADSLDQFWENLLSGKDTFQRGPIDGTRVGVTSAPDNIRDFDRQLFGFSLREAALTDPQQRVLMSVAYDALLHASCVEAATGMLTGCYLGGAESSYLREVLLPEKDSLAGVDPLAVEIGNSRDFIATRLAYALGLRGPSVSVSSACSTSLLAIHLACRALLNGECRMALAGGARIKAPEPTGYVSRPGGITSGSGVCRVFDAGADGTVFGSGAGVVVLKRYEDAVADGDFVHAVILGSAVNNDGARKVGFTAPSVAGQTEVILEALEAAGVHADELGLIEAHGTGTRLGDPIEVRALQAGFAAQRGQTDLPPPVPRAQAARCFLGSVKSNIGHLDTAAGVAGLIKAALAVRHGEIPATLNFSRLNPEIDLSDGRFEIAASRRPWPNSVAGGPVARRVAGVSAFGIGGTNVHMILSAAPERPAAESDRSEESPQALFLSARSAAALAQYRTDLAAWLERAEAEAHPLPAIAATLRTRRPAATWRLAVIAASRTEAAAALRAAPLPAGETTAPGALAFVFPGQGSQHPAMIAPHYARHVVYRVAYDRVASAMPAPVRSVLEDLARGTHVSEAALARTEVTQPALFAASYAAAALWQAREVHPEAGLLGHSIGEYAAACLAGVMTPESAARIVAARGALMQAAPPGRMLAVGLSAEDLAPYLAEGEVDIAALNGPRQTVLAGSEAAIAALRDRLAANGQRSVVLATSHGFHSRLFDEAAARFAEIIAAEPLKPPQARVISNVTGAVLKAEAAQDPAYWARQMRAPVRFHDGLVTLMSGPTPPQAILEVGPGATLTGLIRHAALTPRPVCLPGSPPAPQTTDDPFLTTAATLWTLGHPSSWPTPPHTTPPLPTPKLNTRDFWIGEMTETGA